MKYTFALATLLSSFVARAAENAIENPFASFAGQYAVTKLHCIDDFSLARDDFKTLSIEVDGDALRVEADGALHVKTPYERTEIYGVAGKSAKWTTRDESICEYNHHESEYWVDSGEISVNDDGSLAYETFRSYSYYRNVTVTGCTYALKKLPQ